MKPQTLIVTSLVLQVITGTTLNVAPLWVQVSLIGLSISFNFVAMGVLNTMERVQEHERSIANCRKLQEKLDHDQH